MPTFRKLLRVIFATLGMPLLFERGSPVRGASMNGSSKNDERLHDVPDHTAALWARPAYGTAGRARAQETNARITGFDANERNQNKHQITVGVQQPPRRGGGRFSARWARRRHSCFLVWMTPLKRLTPG